MTFIVDTTKALYTEGDWYLIGVEQFASLANKYDWPHSSIVYHHCRNTWKKDENSYIYHKQGLYRIAESEFNLPCADCGSVVPETLRGIWLLHNFDSIQREGF